MHARTHPRADRKATGLWVEIHPNGFVRGQALEQWRPDSNTEAWALNSGEGTPVNLRQDQEKRASAGGGDEVEDAAEPACASGGGGFVRGWAV